MMREYQQYRVELTGDDAEKIIREHMVKYLADRGYELDYSQKEDPYPDTIWRGIKRTDDETL